MADDATLCRLLQELDSIANAAMTAEQRALRAKPVLERAGVNPADILRALAQEDLPWNADKAREYGRRHPDVAACCGNCRPCGRGLC